MKCPYCGSDQTVKNGKYHDKKTGEIKQEIHCKACGRYPRISIVPQDKPATPSKNQSTKKFIQPSAGISEIEFREKHDNRYILTKKAAALLRGQLVPEPQFIEMCHVRQNAGYKGIVVHPDFEKYRGRAGGTWYWSHPETIKKLKNEGLMT